MLARLLCAIILPRLTLAATAAACVFRFGEDGVLPTLVAWVLCLFATFAAVTGGSPYRPRLEPKPDAPTREEREQEKAEKNSNFHARLILACLALVGGTGAFMSGVQDTLGRGDRHGFVLMMAAIDGSATILLLWWFNGWQSFARAEAWREVRRAHKRHRDLIGDEYPLPVILAELHALGDDVSPAAAWKAANDILRRLNTTARKTTEDRAKERAAREAEERERIRAAEQPPPPEVPAFTPPLDSDEPAFAEPVPEAPMPDLRAAWEEARAAASEYATQRGLPPDVLAGEFERIDEEFRRKGMT